MSAQLSELLSGQTTEITSSVSSGYHFQWLKDGSPIGGATQNNLTVSEPGAYRLTITSEWGCAATSREIVIRKSLITAIEPERNGIEVSFFPNPFVREATAKVTMDTPSGITITLLNTQGKALYEETVLTVSDVHHVPLDLSEYHSGLYFSRCKIRQGHIYPKNLKTLNIMRYIKIFWISLILCMACDSEEPKTVTELIQNRWSVSLVTEDGVLVYSKESSNNIKNTYERFELVIGTDGSVSITELDGHRSTGVWEVSGDEKTLTLKDLFPAPSDTGGVIHYTIDSVDENTLVIIRISKNPKTGGTINVYTLKR
ncbi:MAG: hypothetical protein LRY55_05065 [Leadbetterella sp.]|nr:hypothetical protein [Leadbetterella sp.]